MPDKVTKTELIQTDKLTGEVLAAVDTVEITNVHYCNDEPDYVKLYCEAWATFRGLERVRMPVVAAMLPYMSYAENGQVIYTNSTMKQLICDKLNISMKTLNNEIGRLVKAGVLERKGRGTFRVNPDLVGKGSWTHIKNLRATWSIIGKDAGSVTVDIEHDE